LKFLSDKWIKRAKEIADDKLDPEKDLKNVTTSLLNIIENIPPNGNSIFFFISVKDGVIHDLLVEKEGTTFEKDTEFVVMGNYDTFVQIFKGEMSTVVALIKNRVRFKGDKIKAMQFLKPLDRLTECLREIETEF
jgi:putative sterol carrier protein